MYMIPTQLKIQLGIISSGTSGTMATVKTFWCIGIEYSKMKELLRWSKLMDPITSQIKKNALQLLDKKPYSPIGGHTY